MPEEIKTADEVWSANDEIFNCDSLCELLNENDELEVGTIVWKGDKIAVDITGYVDASDIIEMLGERANDDVGEVAEEWPDVKGEAREELDALLSAWVSKHCTATFYRVRNVVEYRITADDLPEQATP